MCREPRTISRDRDGSADPGGLRRRREAAIDRRVAAAGARHHGQSATGPRRPEPTGRPGRAVRGRAPRAAERGRQAHGGFAPAPPTAPAPPGTPPLLGSATTTPAADLYRTGVDQLRSKATDAAILT